jgi:rod shape-determining protein MreD
MKRIITLLILIILSFLLQTTILSFHNASGLSPNLLMIITMSFGIMRGRREGMLVGFTGGFLMDVFYNSLMGPYMLLFMTIGYVNGFFHKDFIMDNAMLPVLVITADEIVYNVMIYLFSYLLRNRTDFFYYFVHVLLPETIYTVIVAAVIYRFYVLVNRLLKKKSVRKEKRSII